MKPRVLLVEDDPTSRAFLCAALLALPVAVSAAASCAQARDLAQARTHAAWLIDAHLPDGSGIELLQALRARDPHTPAIAHTAARDPAMHERLRVAGFARVLAKPLSVAALRAALLGHAELDDAAATRVAEPAVGPLAPLWDDGAALAALNGARPHVDALRRLFLAELPQLRAAVRAALAGDDGDALGSALHRLNAGCGLVGAMRLDIAARGLQAAPGSDLAAARFDAEVDALLASA